MQIETTRAMRVALCGAALAVIALPAAAASQAERLRQAETPYDDYKYDEAIKLLTTLLADPALTDGPTRQRARLLLAFSRYLKGQEADAKLELVKVFRENSDYPLDRDATHPNLVRLFDQERERYLASLKRVPLRPAIVQSAPSTPVWPRIFPLGIGHFSNRDYAVGAVFLSVEVALVAANIATAFFNNGMKQPDGLYRPGTSPLGWKVAQDATAFAIPVMCVIEILDAFLASPARATRAIGSPQ